MSPRQGSKPRRTDRLVVGRNVTLTLSGSLELAVRECSSPAARKRGPELWNTEAEDIVGIRCQAVLSEDSRLRRLRA
jgi:hypothetical protein